MPTPAHPDLLCFTLRYAITAFYKQLPAEIRVLILEYVAVPHYPPYRRWDALQYSKPVRPADIVNLIVGSRNVINIMVDASVLEDMGVVLKGYVKVLKTRVAELECGIPTAQEPEEGMPGYFWVPRRNVNPVLESSHLQKEIEAMNEWLAVDGTEDTGKT